MFSSTTLITVMVIATGIAAVNLGAGLVYARHSDSAVAERRSALLRDLESIEAARAEARLNLEHTLRRQQELAVRLNETESRLKDASIRLRVESLESRPLVERLVAALRAKDRDTLAQVDVIELLVRNGGISNDGARMLGRNIRFTNVEKLLAAQQVQQVEDETQDH